MAPKKTDKAKVPVSKRAVIQRINRALEPRQEQLKITRGDRWRGDLGDYYVLDVNRNAIVAKHVDLEKMAHDLGALKPYEALRNGD